jgi:hypothetical protein
VIPTVIFRFSLTALHCRSQLTGYASSTMATLVDTAISTSTKMPELPRQRHAQSNGKQKSGAVPPKSVFKKYNHVYTIHRENKPSPLSQDSEETISFFGFKNLMALMLSKCSQIGQVYISDLSLKLCRI